MAGLIGDLMESKAEAYDAQTRSLAQGVDWGLEY